MTSARRANLRNQVAAVRYQASFETFHSIADLRVARPVGPPCKRAGSVWSLPALSASTCSMDSMLGVCNIFASLTYGIVGDAQVLRCCGCVQVFAQFVHWIRPPSSYRPSDAPTGETASLANPASQRNLGTPLANPSRKAERWRFQPNCSQTVLAPLGTF